MFNGATIDHRLLHSVDQTFCFDRIRRSASCDAIPSESRVRVEGHRSIFPMTFSQQRTNRSPTRKEKTGKAGLSWRVIPYDLNTELDEDYADKSRHLLPTYSTSSESEAFSHKSSSPLTKIL